MLFIRSNNYSTKRSSRHITAVSSVFFGAFLMVPGGVFIHRGYKGLDEHSAEYKILGPVLVGIGACFCASGLAILAWDRFIGGKSEVKPHRTDVVEMNPTAGHYPPPQHAQDAPPYTLHAGQVPVGYGGPPRPVNYQPPPSPSVYPGSPPKMSQSQSLYPPTQVGVLPGSPPPDYSEIQQPYQAYGESTGHL